MPPIVTPTSSMTGSDSNNSVLALFLKAGTGALSLGALAGGADTDFAKIGLIDTATLNIETTVVKREAENSKLTIKTIGQKKDRSITVDALIPTSVVLSCANAYIADYYATVLGVDVPDDATDLEGEAVLIYLDEDEDWDETIMLAHNGIEWWKSVKIVGNGSKTFDGTSSYIEPFEVHLQRDSSGSSVRKMPATDGNEAPRIDVTEEYVNFGTLTTA